MAAVAHNNVIQFPDATLDPLVRPDRTPALKASRDFLAQKLRETLRVLLPEIDEEMLTRGDLADERELRNLYYGAHETLRHNAARLETLLAANWVRLFNAAVRGGDKTNLPGQASDHVALDDLQLVDFGDMDEDIAVKAIASQLREGFEDGLFAAGRRLAFLAGRDDGVIDVAELFAESLRATMADVDLTIPARLEVLRAVGSHALRSLAPAIHGANTYMIGQKILPTLRRSYARPTTGKPGTATSQGTANAADVFALLQRLVSTGSASSSGGPTAGAPGLVGPSAHTAVGAHEQAISMATMVLAMEKVMTSLDVLQRAMAPAADIAPTTNVLREFRNSEAGRNLGHIDAVTADIVATLFDFVFDDPAIADPIKALIGRMQIPVLKVAMLDKSFFSSKAHPARRLLDGISRAAVRCGPQVGREDPLYAQVAQLIEHLQREFNQDTALFDILCTDLNVFLDDQEVAADEFAAQAAPLVEAQERRVLAAQAADDVLAGWLAMPLPAAVTDMLSNEWRNLLVRHALAGDSESWTAAVNTIAELVASVQPHPDVRRRSALATKLPTLVKRIHDSMNEPQIPDARRHALFDALFKLHAAVLRGTSPEVTVAPLAPIAPLVTEPEITSEVIEHADIHLAKFSLRAIEMQPARAGASSAAAEVAKLQRGDWVEFLDGDDGLVRYRLAWISPLRGILLFTNPHSPRALSITPVALSLQIKRSEAAILSTEPIFDRAVNRALDSLKAA